MIISQLITRYSLSEMSEELLDWNRKYADVVSGVIVMSLLLFVTCVGCIICRIYSDGDDPAMQRVSTTFATPKEENARNQSC